MDELLSVLRSLSSLDDYWITGSIFMLSNSLVHLCRSASVCVCVHFHFMRFFASIASYPGFLSPTLQHNVLYASERTAVFRGVRVRLTRAGMSRVATMISSREI